MLVKFILLCIVGYACFIKTIWSMMEFGGMFDIISRKKWSAWLDGMYQNKNPLEKILGGCEKCGSFWWFVVYFPIYSVALYTCNVRFSMWQYLSVFCIIWFVAALAGLYVLSFKKKKDGV